MSYEKVWANNEKLNQTEKNKLAKRWFGNFLMIFLTMRKNGFESIPKRRVGRI